MLLKVMILKVSWRESNKMDTIQAISTVGFPIVAFLMLFWQSTNTIKANTTAIKELTIMIKSKI